MLATRLVSILTVGPSGSDSRTDIQRTRKHASSPNTLKRNGLWPFMERCLHSPHPFKRQIEALSELREATPLAPPVTPPLESPTGCPFFSGDHSSSCSFSQRLSLFFGLPSAVHGRREINKTLAAINQQVAEF